MEPKVAAATNDHDRDRELARLTDERKHVDVAIALRGHDLLCLHLLERGELIAQRRGAFVLEVVGGLLHGAREFAVHLVVAALENLDGRRDIARIVLARNELHAGRRASADLVLQAGPAAVLEEGVAAVPDAEDLLHALQGVLDGAGAREWPEVPSRQIARAAVKHQARIFVSRR